MGYVKTVTYGAATWKGANFAEYNDALQGFFADVGLLKKTVMGGKDVLIIDPPEHKSGWSEYSVVIHVEVSASNGDWTQAFRDLVMSPRTEEERETLAEFKRKVFIIAGARLGRFFNLPPEQMGGFRVWLKRLDAAFIGPP